MKNTYVEPKLYFVAIQTEDILSTSGTAYVEESADDLNFIDIGDILSIS